MAEKQSYSEYEKSTFQSKIKSDEYLESEYLYDIEKTIIKIIDNSKKKGLDSGLNNFLENLRSVKYEEIDTDKYKSFRNNIFDMYLILKYKGFSFIEYYDFLVHYNDDNYEYIEDIKTKTNGKIKHESITKYKNSMFAYIESNAETFKQFRIMIDSDNDDIIDEF